MTTPAHAIQTALRWRVAVTDRAFDRLYPEDVRQRSSVHWTPVAVARRAAAWLVPEVGTRVLDVGSGPGKVCCIGALSHGGTWHGVERDPALVEIAQATAAALEIERSATFRAAEMDEVDWSGFDSFYFYNPFAAILFGPAPFEQDVRWSMLTEQIARTETRLAALPVGTRVVIYQGFGGDMPAGYAVAETEMFGDAQLVLWVKRRSRRRQNGPTVSPSSRSGR